MDDEPTTSNDGRVSVTKAGKTGPAGPAPARPASGRSGLGKLLGGPNLATDGSLMPPPPKQVVNAAIAIAVSAVAALVASLTLFGEKSWLLREATKSNAKLKKPKAVSTLPHTVDATVSSHLVATLVLVLALAFVTRGVLRGRSWARWGVIGLWVLATLTGAFSGFTYLLGIASDEPVAFKLPAFVSSAAFIAAVVFVSIRPSAEYFARTRPVRANAAAGSGARRPGLFGPRSVRPGFGAPAGARTTAEPARASARDGVERSRAKQRATTESVAKGAELARARAKASKSRRSGV